MQETEPASADERPNLHSLLVESGEPAVSDAVVVEGGAPVNHNYTMSEREDDEDGEHPAALLLLSLRLPPRRRPGRSGAGLNCVLCTAIKTLQCQKQSDGDPPGRGRSKTM